MDQKKATDFGILELDKLVIKLNHDLAPIAHEIGKLLQQFNADTCGHGVDLRADCDWQRQLRYGEAFGSWALTRITLGAKHIDLPSAHR